MNASEFHRLAAFCLVAVLPFAQAATAQIPQPNDAPQPFSPEESAARFTLPDGFRMQLVASERLVRDPSGACWDADGKLFVCELHGYNLEGQYDIGRRARRCGSAVASSAGGRAADHG